MQKNILVGCALLGMSVLVSAPAVAYNKAGTVTLTTSAGYDFFASRRNLQDTFVLPTVALAYNIDPTWALEGSYGTVLDTKRSNSAGGGHTRGGLYLVDGLYRFEQHAMLQPYVSAGVGLLYLNPNGTDATNQMNVNAGVGAQAFFAESVALRGEVKDLYTMAGGKNDLLVDFGVSFLMG